MLTKLSRYYSLLAISATLLFVVANGAYFAATWPIWYDESFTLHAIGLDWRGMMRMLAFDIHPPFYYVLAKLWVGLFGNELFAVRVLSVVFACAGLVLQYAVSVRLFGPRNARLMLPFMTIAPMLLRFAPEARMYTLMYLITMAGLWVLTAHKLKRRWLWFGVTAGLGMMTHYLYAPIIVAQAVWMIITAKQRHRLIYPALGSLAVGGIIVIAWLPIILVQFATKQQHGFWIPPISWHAFFDYFGTVWLYRLTWELSWPLSMLVITASVMVGYAAVKLWRRERRHTQRDGLILLALIALLPPALVAIISLKLQPMYQERYFMVSFIVAVMLIGYVAARAIEQRLLPCVATYFCLFAIVLGGTLHVFQIGNYIKIEHLMPMDQSIAADAYKVHPAPIAATNPLLYIRFERARPSGMELIYVPVHQSHNEDSVFGMGPARKLPVGGAWVAEPYGANFSPQVFGANSMSECRHITNDVGKSYVTLCYAR